MIYNGTFDFTGGTLVAAGSFTISGTVTEMTQNGASNTGNMRGSGGK